MTTLRVVSGSDEATVADGRTYLVGRSRDADIVIADGRVSRRHLLIEPADDRCIRPAGRPRLVSRLGIGERPGNA